ncbi:MAG: cytidylate kinase family protein [Candidatus Moranbacteria bacterium]|nr:cytidylate kinase family protein [Candidatus Moranbacteria bacterium]
MIITITGDLGSGKSTVGKMLAKELELERYYIGQIRRDAAKKMGMTLEEYNKYGETHPETDIDVDNYQKKLGQEKDNFLIEGRTSWFLIPHSIKLYFEVDPREGAKRVFKELQGENVRNEVASVSSVEELMKIHKKRNDSDNYRYKKYYGKDCYDKKNFDFIIDTTNLTPQEALEKTLEYIKTKQS